MKISAALLCLLLTATAISPEELAGSDEVSIICCYMMTTKMIPFQKLKSYTLTSTQCPQEGVIFTTKLNKKICANPAEKWVKNSMLLLDQKSCALQP